MSRVGRVSVPSMTTPGGVPVHRARPPTQDRIVAIAKGQAKPRTVEEAKLVLAYMAEQRRIRNQKELEAKRAMLAFERGTGTTARVKRAFKELPSTSARARVEAERRARAKIGAGLRRLRGFRF